MIRDVRRIDSSSDFSFYNLYDYNQVSKINPKAKLKTVRKNNVVIYYMDDFLLYPHQFINFLKKFPAFSNNARRGMYRPGMSQKFHSELFRHFEKLMYSLNASLDNIVWCSNIMNSDMYCSRQSWCPHVDTGCKFVMNYWMCEQEGKTGTIFYSYKGKTYADNNFSLEEEVGELEKYKPNQTWRNINPKDIDELEAVYFTPVKFNRVVFYDPLQIHGPYITNNTYLKNNYRYSLVGFGK